MDAALHLALSAALPPSVELTRLGVTEAGWLGLTLRDRRDDSTFVLRLAPARAHDAPVRSSLGGWFSPDARAGLVVARQLLQQPSWLHALLSRLPHLALDTRRGLPLDASLDALARLGAWAPLPDLAPGTARAMATPRRLFELFDGLLLRAPAAAGTLTLEHVGLATRPGAAAVVSAQLRVGGEPLPPVLLGPAALVPRPFAVFGDTALAIDHGGQLDPDALPWPVAVATSWVSALLAVGVARGGWSWPAGPALSEPAQWPPHASQPLQRAGVDTPVGVADDELHLELTSDCGQACVFCEVRQVLTPVDGGDEALRQYERLLRDGRARGCTRLHLGGVDPLGFSRLLPLLQLAREAGYRSLTVTTPGRRFADAGFRRAFRAHAPAAVRAVVPLYGATAATHDTVVGVPGAHAEVHAALAGLRAEWGPDEVTVMLVAAQANAAEQAALAAWTLQQALPVLAQPVYPMSGARSPAWDQSAVRLSEVVAGFAAPLRAGEDAPALRARLAQVLGMLVPYPCVRKAGLAPADWALDVAGAAEVRPLPGLDSGALRARHRREALPSAVVPCAHAARCAAASRCPREVYAAYVASFGAGEFAPVLDEGGSADT